MAWTASALSFMLNDLSKTIVFTGSQIPLAELRPSWVGDTYGAERLRFELLGFSGSAALLAIAAVEARRLRVRRPSPTHFEWLPLLCFLLVGLQALQLVGEYAEKLYDYECYERAARAIRNGRNPYAHPTFRYLYPPLLAQSLAALFHALRSAYAALGIEARPAQLWDVVFYLYQSAQVGLVVASYLLSARFARTLGLAAPVAAALCAALLLVDSPLLRTLRWSQVNLAILVCVVAATLLRARAPVAAGLLLALGIHLKLQPAILLLPWGLTQQWRALAGCGAGVLFIALLQTSGGSDWTLWQQFYQFAFQFPQGAHYRDNGLHSLVYNTLSLARTLPVRAGLALSIEWVWRALALAAAAWMLWRGWQRESARERLSDAFRHGGHAADALALILLAAPLVWEHHYVLAIPLFLYAAAGWGRTHPVPLGSAAVLCFAIPTFDVFPWSYHRLAGLLWLLWRTRSPEGLRR